MFISLGEKGAYYREGASEGIVETKPVQILSATGAGDAFSAAILLSHVMGLSAKEAAQMGIACASVALQSQTAVNPAMSMERVRAFMALS